MGVVYNHVNDCKMDVSRYYKIIKVIFSGFCKQMQVAGSKKYNYKIKNIKVRKVCLLTFYPVLSSQISSGKSLFQKVYKVSVQTIGFL